MSLYPISWYLSFRQHEPPMQQALYILASACESVVNPNPTQRSGLLRWLILDLYIPLPNCHCRICPVPWIRAQCLDFLHILPIVPAPNAQPCPVVACFYFATIADSAVGFPFVNNNKEPAQSWTTRKAPVYLPS
jgi:hypothetical protein